VRDYLSATARANNDYGWWRIESGQFRFFGPRLESIYLPHIFKRPKLEFIPFKDYILHPK